MVCSLRDPETCRRPSLAPILQGAAGRIRQLIANYAAAVDAADIKLAAQVWDNSPDVSFIYPLGQAHGWDEVKGFFTDIMGGLFSERRLTPRDIKVHVYGDSAWAEFNWHFTAMQKKDGASVQTDGHETQIYRKAGNRWARARPLFGDAAIAVRSGGTIHLIASCSHCLRPPVASKGPCSIARIAPVLCSPPPLPACSVCIPRRASGGTIPATDTSCTGR